MDIVTLTLFNGAIPEEGFANSTAESVGPAGGGGGGGGEGTKLPDTIIGAVLWKDRPSL